MIRGSGIPLDLRRDRPYSIYDRLEFDVCVGTGEKGTLGDCWDRYWVKMHEMKQCVRILRQCIAQMPDGAFRAKLPRSMKVPPGEVYAEYENPRGHLGFYIESQGGVDPVPRQDPRPVVREPRRDGRTVPQRAAGGCAGDRRIDRYRDGRSGPVRRRRNAEC